MPPRQKAPADEQPDATTTAAPWGDGPPPHVHEALRQVMLAVGPIAKDRRVKEGGGPKFNFRGIDDVLNACHDALALWGVMFVPSRYDIIDASVGETKSGTTQYHLLGVQHYRVYGPAGDWIDAAVPCEALDLSDKAASKALSMAYKYLVIQTLSIPVEGLDESDQASIPRESGPSADEVLTRLDEAAKKVGRTAEQVTEKWRADNGGITYDEFTALPVDRIFPVVRQIVAYVNRITTEAPQTQAQDTPTETEQQA